MSNKTQLQANNTQLASLIQELQGKASGGSGAVETCTVTFTMTGTPVFNSVSYSTIENGAIVYSTLTGTAVNSTAIEAIKGTIVVFDSSTGWNSSSATNATLLFDSGLRGAIAVGTGDTAVVTLIKTSGGEK